MTNEHHPADEPRSTPPAPMSVKGAARRRFARAGVGASGVLMTLASAPGMACVNCVTTSGFNSATVGSSLSTAVKSGIVCNGAPPSSWVSLASDVSRFPSSYQTRTFSSVFTSGTTYFTVPAVTHKDTTTGKTVTDVAAHELTMLDAVKGAADGMDGGVAKMFAAVYLNICVPTIRTNYISLTKLTAMFKSSVNSNVMFYPETGNAKTWNKAMIAQYLVGTY